MTVFILMREYDYEGADLVGVYASLDGAKRRGEQDASEFGWDQNARQWAEPPGLWRMSFGSSHFVIHQESVEG